MKPTAINTLRIPMRFRHLFLCALFLLTTTGVACEKKSNDAAKKPDAATTNTAETGATGGEKNNDKPDGVKIGVGSPNAAKLNVEKLNAAKIGVGKRENDKLTAEKHGIGKSLTKKTKTLLPAPVKKGTPTPAGTLEEQEASLTALLSAGVTAEDSVKPNLEKPTSIELAKLQKTPSGLRYYDHSIGEGDAPVLGDTVEVHYTGWLVTGERFDSSLKHNQTTKFELGRVVEGWNEGLQTMKPGGKRTLVLPPDLAYGKRGMGRVIPANAVLVFEIALVSVEKVTTVEEQMAKLPAFFAGGSIPADPKLPGEEKPTPLEIAKLTTTPSGLRTFDHIVGDGSSPERGDTIDVYYTAWFADGKIFASSFQKGGIAEFSVGRVMPGWDEGIKDMKEGGKRTLVIPPRLALGVNPRGHGAPKNAVLVFEISLIKVKKPLSADQQMKKLPALIAAGVVPPDPKLPGKEKPAPFDLSALQTTPSGLQHFDHLIGEGASPKMGDTVEVHYSGWLTDGTQFDSSVVRGKTSSFALGQVVEGWNEGLQTMKVGGKRTLVLPPALGYGARAKGKIPTNSVLVFEVTLLGVTPKK